MQSIIQRMAKPRYHIFLSYRREDGKDLARTLKETLVGKGYRVFLDMDELQDGVFDERILAAIEEAPIYMLIMTKHCFDRCHNADDWVRQELEYAIKKGKVIIPINPDRQFVGYPDTMPQHLKDALKSHQYSAVDTEQLYQESIDKLVTERIRPVLGFRHKALVWAIVLFFVTLVPYMVAYYCVLPKYYIKKGDNILAQDSLSQADTLKAIKYYQYAIDAKNIEGYGRLGTIYYKELLDRRSRYANNDTALMYFRKGAYAGDGYSQTRLALCLKDTWAIGGFKLNADSAFYWAETAYKNNYFEGAATLAEMYREGVGVAKEGKKAERLYKEALKNNDYYGGVRNNLFIEFDMGLLLRDETYEHYDFVEGTKYWINCYQKGDVLTQIFIVNDKYWIFDPAIDSVSTPDIRITAIAHHTKDTMRLYCEWYNSKYFGYLPDGTFGGWMQIDSSAYVENAWTKERYSVTRLQDCKFSPDTTHVPWHDIHRFVLLFTDIPDTLTKINFCESDTSDWKLYGIDLSNKIHIEPFVWDTTYRNDNLNK